MLGIYNKIEFWEDTKHSGTEYMPSPLAERVI